MAGWKLRNAAELAGCFRQVVPTQTQGKITGALPPPDSSRIPTWRGPGDTSRSEKFVNKDVVIVTTVKRFANRVTSCSRRVPLSPADLFCWLLSLSQNLVSNDSCSVALGRQEASAGYRIAVSCRLRPRMRNMPCGVAIHQIGSYEKLLRSAHDLQRA
ncbi:hypothetical protein IG631_11664 [Alternaria alternata]|nr:hypothetical protein IG631_11664 [Alternaria alternata]